ncbi:hypothetical protein GTY86_33865 [Streptomyces sp. SID5770]|uniref:hypothetical protein n=1 Tax=Streptomyces sp. SID5770 TaxID=2690308 RepID=UPI00136B3D5E|nr:hypothetical protein [Streptomyces sp. SID5770]MZE56170.1 hypothetical protein [Streptomyces sp. SID5770]
MRNVMIVQAVRKSTGKRRSKGALVGVRPVQLLAHAVAGLPRPLAVASVAALVSSALSFILAAYVFWAGEGWLGEKVSDGLGEKVFSPPLQAVIPEGVKILGMRSFVWVLLGVAMFAIFACRRNGGRLVAFLTSLTVLAFLGMSAVEFGDEVPSISKFLNVTSAFSAMLAAAGYWAPSSRSFDGRQRAGRHRRVTVRGVS